MLSTMRRFCSAFIFYAAIVFALTAALTLQTNAQEACTLQDTTFSGTTTLSQGEYDVYVKLDSSQADANVTAVTSRDDNLCTEIGATTASSDEWQRAGSVTINDASQPLQLSLTSNELSLTYQFDRPTLLLVSKHNPVCTPDAGDCLFSINGESAALELLPSQPDTGTLRLYIPKPVDTRSIKEVSYYADSALMYKTNTLQPFDTQSIPAETRTLSRVITFSDGNVATIKQAPTIEHADSLSAILFRTARKYQVFLVWAAILLAIIILYYLVRLFIHLYRQHQYWRYAHGLIKTSAMKPPKPSVMTRLYGMGHAQRVVTGFKILATIAAIGIVSLVIVDGFVAQLSTVRDGSMESSLSQGDQVVIDKSGATFALINQSDFVPKRGQIVAIRPASSEQSMETDTLHFRRVIGLPGDRVVIEGDTILIYNDEYPDGLNPEEGADWTSKIVPQTSDQTVYMQLTTNQVFLMGDNRPGAIDSRQVGPIPLKNIVGVVQPLN